jgi:hypothetical protein
LKKQNTYRNEIDILGAKSQEAGIAGNNRRWVSSPPSFLLTLISSQNQFNLSKHLLA